MFKDMKHYFLSHFCHLATLIWTALVLGHFRDAVWPGFSRYLIDDGDSFMRLALISVMGDISVEISQVLCLRFLCASFVLWLPTAETLAFLTN